MCASIVSHHVHRLDFHINKYGTKRLQVKLWEAPSGELIPLTHLREFYSDKPGFPAYRRRRRRRPRGASERAALAIGTRAAACVPERVTNAGECGAAC